MGIRPHQAFTIALMLGVGVYTGVKFFEPIVIEQLRKDGNLRSDIPIPKYDDEGNIVITDNVSAPDSKWEEVRASTGSVSNSLSSVSLPEVPLTSVPLPTQTSNSNDSK